MCGVCHYDSSAVEDGKERGVKMNKKINDQELKKVLEEIMKDFHDFCCANQIEYFVGYGTLLGTIRHKGFIPWDDDLDVIMPRKDYQRLVEIYNKRESPYRLKDVNTDARYPYSFAKIYDSRTKLVETLYHEYQMGIYIDVFPLDLWPSDEKVIRKIDFWNNVSKIKAYRIGKEHGLKKNIALLLLKLFFCGVTLKRALEKKIDLAEHSEKDQAFMGNVCSGFYGEAEKLKAEWLSGSTAMEFEHIVVNVPVHYDEILTHIYGDYMTPPPLNKQVTHHSNEAFFIG